MVQFLLQELSRITCRTGSYFFRCPDCHNITAFVSALRSEVYHVIGTFYDIHVVLDDHDGVSATDQRIKCVEQLAYIVKCSPVVGSSKMNKVGSAFS